MSDELMRREVGEAVQAGRNALWSLERAKESLHSAGNWGLVDLFGGGFLTDMMKHSKIGDAKGAMEDARTQLMIFQKELRDVRVPMDFRMEISNFLSFADFFFDGLVADYLVQKKIREAEEQVNDAIHYVQHLIQRLGTLDV